MSMSSSSSSLFRVDLLLPHETIVSPIVKGSSSDASLDTMMKLVFHHRHGARDAPPAAGWGPAHPVEPARARVAPLAGARRGAAQTHRLSLARHAGAVRRFPVAGSGDPARGRRRDADSGPADREGQSGRRTTPVPRAARSRLSPAGRALSKSPQKAGAEVIG